MKRAFQNEIPLPFEWHLQRYEVVDSKGKSVAPVLDLLYDEKAKAVRYVMIEVGGAVGISGKKVLLMPELLTRAGAGQMLCEVSEQIIEEAPSPEDPEHPTREEEKAIYEYFEKEPYWHKELPKKQEGEQQPPPNPAKEKQGDDGKKS
jgi:hypothetical protein